MTGSELRIKNAGINYLRMTKLMFQKLGVEVKVDGEITTVDPAEKLSLARLYSLY